MTIAEFNHLPFRFACHLSMASEHASTYATEIDGHSFGMCVHVPWNEKRMEKKKGGRSYIHYSVDGKVYKTIKKLEEAIRNINITSQE